MKTIKTIAAELGFSYQGLYGRLVRIPDLVPQEHLYGTTACYNEAEEKQIKKLIGKNLGPGRRRKAVQQ